MRFSVASLFLVMFSAANAASIPLNRRAAADVESCTQNFYDISNQIATFQPQMNSGGLTDIASEYGKLKDRIKTAQSTCCAITNPITDADADYFLNAYSNTTTLTQGLLSTITSKAIDFNFFTRPIIKFHIKQLEDLNNNLNTCLNTFTPASKSAILQDDITKIEASFNSTIAAYN